MTASQPVRGQVYRVDIGSYGPKPYVVVSNNQRNRALDSVLGARITSTERAHVPTAVSLTPQDPMVGYVLADVIVEFYKDELAEGDYMGSLAPDTIIRLNEALCQALGIP